MIPAAVLGDLSALGTGADALAGQGQQAPAADAPPAAAQEPLGYLLDEPDEAAVCEHVERKLWKAQDKRIKRFDLQWVVNEHVRQGVPGVRVVEATDTAQARVYVPLGASAAKVGIPKAEQLIRKMISTLFVDPPLPEATPSSGEDADRTAAELATRILRDEASESGVNLREDAETACNLAGTYGSAFVWAYVDPQGGGWVPMEVQAHLAAMSYDDDAPDAVLVDPATGEPSDTYVPRFVQPDGTLTAHAVGARRVWRAAVKHRRLTGRHLRFLPETATGVRDAKGVVICQVDTLGALKAMFPDVAALDEAARLKLVGWRPAALAKVVPPGVAVDGDGKATNTDGTVSDDALVMTLTAIYTSHGAYPTGAYVVVGGGDRVLHRQPWTATVGEGDDAKEEPLDLPVAQFRHHTDPSGGNPYGTGAAERLGPGDEIRAAQLAAWLDHLDRFNHPNTYLPLGSTIQPQALARRDGTPILYNADQGKPEHEQVPDFPRAAVELYQAMGAEMNSESGLEETAQGVDTATAQSGVAKQLVVEQALTQLSGIKTNTEDGLVRLCRIDLQLTRGFVDTARLLKYAGEDGGFRVREWTRADLRSTRDVRIARGTFTMLSKSAKQALARDEFSLAMQTRDPQTVAAAWSRYQRITMGTVDPVLGVEDDPHRLRVKRQIGQWLEGAEDQEGNGAAAMPPEAPAGVGAAPAVPGPANPPPGTLDGQGAGLGAWTPGGAAPGGWEPGTAGGPGGHPAAGGSAYSPAPPSAAAVDPMTGQPLPPPADPRAAAIFAPLPVDEEPAVAQLRHDELARTMAGSRYQTMPPPWRAAFDAEYARMKLCAGVQTIPEQQAAQQAAQQQADAQRKAAEQTKQQGAAAQQHAQQQHDAQESHADRQAAAARDDHRLEAQQAAAQQREQLQLAARQGTALDPGASAGALVS